MSPETGLDQSYLSRRAMSEHGVLFSYTRLFLPRASITSDMFEETAVKNTPKSIKTLLFTLQVTILITSTETVLASAEPEAVIITATRTARTIDDTMASVSVISRKDIERLQVQSIQDLLRNEVGFSVANSGGSGKLSSTFIRGTEFDHVLVLVDGIKIGSATSGATAFQNLSINNIERIEIVRGPRSSLYGSEAIGGVIQIFTRKGSKQTTPDFSTSVGKYNTKKVHVGVSGGGKQAWYNIGLSGFNTEGFNSCTGKPFPNGAGCFTVEPDNDAYRQRSASLRAGYRFKNGIETDLTFSHSQGDAEFDGDFQNEGDTVQQVVGGSVKFTPTDDWLATVTVGRSLDQSDNFKDGAYASTFDTERDSLSWQNDITFNNNHLLTVGLDYLDDQVDSSVLYNVTSRDNKGIFTQYQGTYAANNIIVAARRDDNQQFGSHSTGSLSWGYNFKSGIRLTAAYGSAYKAPSFNELYFPGSSNPNLAPESSKTLEAGIKGKARWGRWDVTAFRTEVDELIAFDSTTFTPVNINSAAINGIEARVQSKWSSWDVDANLTLLDAKNKSTDPNLGNELPRRNKLAFNINLDRQYGKFHTGISLHSRSSSYDDLANNRKIKGYTTVDVRLAYHFAKDWLLQARIDNLFDKDYETISFYNQPKGDFWLTLRYQPKQ